jgi:ABC-type multidrug transport system ATPase subunit
MDSPAIETRALTRRFGTRPAVDSLALSVPQGCIYGFLGPNGAGKTTTIRLLLGLLRPNEGNIFLYGEPFTWERRDLLRDVGALVETPSVYPHLTGRENLDLTRRILGLPGASVEESLDLTGLCADAGRVVRTYSLGMRQRLGLALARLGKPRLLILDEPANGLDPAGTRELRALLLQLAKEHQVTIFLSNHLLSEVEHIADHIGVINRGQLVFQGELRELRRCQPPLIVSVDRPLEAAHLLNASGWRAVEDSNHALSVHAVSETEAAQVNRALVMGGIHVYEIRRQEVTLEELFSPACRPSGHRRRRMNGFFRVVTVEGLKLRRTLAFRLAVLAPLFIVILQFTIELVRASEESGASPGLNPLRACFENRSGRGLRARRGDWRGATREHIREKSVTEEQRR